MLPFDLNLYKPTELELWISQKYLDSGVVTPSAMDLEAIAEIFDCCVTYTKGNPKVIFDEYGGLIFLSINDSKEQQRLSFFHELSHVALHVGDQRKLPRPFVDLQESQAAQFQYYTSMPSFMLEKFEVSKYLDNYLTMLSESFMLPRHFVQRRIEQVQRRIYREHQERNLRARMTPRPVIYSYSDETLRILNQLHRQVAEKKGVYNVGS